MIKLYFTVLFRSYPFHFPVSLFITAAAIWNTFVTTEDRYSLWEVYGWTSLPVVLLPLGATITLLVWSWLHFKNIKKYYDKYGNKL